MADKRTFNNLLGGLAGALALNILHETMKRLDKNAPRIDKVGKEALSKSIRATRHKPPKGEKLFAATLGADVLSNALYYSMIGRGDDKSIVQRGAAFGLLAGAGAVTLTGRLGLDDHPVTKTTQTKVMTVGWYLVGGVVAALAIRRLRNRKKMISRKERSRIIRAVIE